MNLKGKNKYMGIKKNKWRFEEAPRRHKKVDNKK
jgi:hypothetical protein